ncbi:tail fiber protein, partial [Escherichia coli]
SDTGSNDETKAATPKAVKAAMDVANEAKTKAEEAAAGGGVPGPKGEKGDPGPRGERGETGPMGPPGASDGKSRVVGIRLGNKQTYAPQTDSTTWAVDLDIGAMITGIGGYNDGNKTLIDRVSYRPLQVTFDGSQWRTVSVGEYVSSGASGFEYFPL